MKKILVFALAAILIAAGAYFTYKYFFVHNPQPKQNLMMTLPLEHVSKGAPTLDIPSPTAKFEEFTSEWQGILTPIFSLLTLIAGFVLVVVQIIHNIKEIDALPDSDPKKQKRLARKQK